MRTPDRISPADPKLSARNFNAIANAIRRGQLVSVSGDVTKRSGPGGISLGRSNRVVPEFLAGFVVKRVSNTKVSVEAGYAVDAWEGTRYFSELELTLSGETYLYAKNVLGDGFELASSHVVHQGSTLPASTDDYLIHPIAHVEWHGTPSDKIGAITQYDVGTLVGTEQPGYRAFFAKITGHSSGNFAFAEQAHNGTGTFTDRAGGYTGTTSVGPAREASGLAVDLAANIIVPMVRVPASDGTDTFVFTLAHWNAATTTTPATSGGATADTVVYTLPRTTNLELPVVSRIHQDGSRLILFTRTLKFDANGNPVSLSAEVNAIDTHTLPEGTANYDLPVWNSATGRWVPGVARGHS